MTTRNEHRERIMIRIRSALSQRTARAPLPDYDPTIAVSRTVDSHAGRAEEPDIVAHFVAELIRVGGRAFDDPAALVAWLADRGATSGICAPDLLPALSFAFSRGTPRITAQPHLAPEHIDDHAFGITRAAAAIAETGTLILTDTTTSSRLAALAPWIHIAVLRRRDIHPTVVHAIAALNDLANDPNIIFCTGPSKTADVEGILIQGVHGPGEQVALLID